MSIKKAVDPITQGPCTYYLQEINSEVIAALITDAQIKLKHCCANILTQKSNYFLSAIPQTI